MAPMTSWLPLAWLLELEFFGLPGDDNRKTQSYLLNGVLQSAKTGECYRTLLRDIQSR